MQRLQEIAKFSNFNISQLQNKCNCVILFHTEVIKLKLLIDTKYKKIVSALDAKELKKYKCIFDLSITDEAKFELEEDGMHIWYSANNNRIDLNYGYKELKRCLVFSNGYAVIFKDKNYIFLNVTNNARENSELLEIGKYFHSNYSALHFIVKQRLCLPMENHRTGKKRISFDKDDSPLFMIGISVLCVLISIIFITMPNRYKPIAKEETQRYEGIYSSYNQDGQGYVDIIFEDETEHTIHQCCAYVEILDGLKALHKGEKLYVLINPTTDYIVELKTESKELLNFDDSQRLMLFEAKAFMWLGIVLDVGAVCLTAYGIYQLIKERKEDK